MPEEMTIEEKLKERYGDTPLVSAPVDPDNPAFDSLLGALKAVHTGEMEMEVLVKYHRELSKQLEESRKDLESMKVADEAGEVKDLSIGSLDIVRVTMGLIGDYIEDPTDEKMADCVDSLLTSISITEYVRNLLDENIQAAGLKE
ncbi:MAG: hypothetical protein K8T10_12040 [Candidatus Eremiobacteraeota bacterium]|nr:hypothetical protein [Candidatus Eremiobacteraeota bacterium]